MSLCRRRNAWVVDSTQRGEAQLHISSLCIKSHYCFGVAFDLEGSVIKQKSSPLTEQIKSVLTIDSVRNGFHLGLSHLNISPKTAANLHKPKRVT